jgi:hypothetical protein
MVPVAFFACPFLWGVLCKGLSWQPFFFGRGEFPMQAQHPPPQVVVVNQPSQVVPALLNAFCWPGLGHFVQGRLLAGLIWLCLWGFSLALCFVVVGVFLAPIVWILSIVDAARYNPLAARGGGGGLLVALIGGGVVLVGVLLALGLLGLGIIAGIGTQREVAENDPTTEAAAPAEEPPAPDEADDETTPADKSNDLIPLSETDTSASPETATPPAETDSPQTPPVEAKPPTPAVPGSSDSTAPSETTPSAELPTTAEPADAGLRQWTDATGAFRIKAKFLSYSNGAVKLEKEDGKVITVSLERLSADDQAFVRGKL